MAFKITDLVIQILLPTALWIGAVLGLAPDSMRIDTGDFYYWFFAAGGWQFPGFLLHLIVRPPHTLVIPRIIYLATVLVYGVLCFIPFIGFFVLIIAVPSLAVFNLTICVVELIQFFSKD